MKIEKLIQLHKKTLDKMVDENILLNQRIKARMKDRERRKPRWIWLAIRKPVIVYSLLLIIFTVLNFILIDGLKKREPLPTQPPMLTLNTLQLTYPGSITHAYSEVMK